MQNPPYGSPVRLSSITCNHLTRFWSVLCDGRQAALIKQNVSLCGNALNEML